MKKRNAMAMMLAVGSLAMVVGCEEKTPETAKPSAPAAGGMTDKMKDAAKDMGDKAKEMGDKAKDAAQDAAKKVGDEFAAMRDKAEG